MTAATKANILSCRQLKKLPQIEIVDDSEVMNDNEAVDEDGEDEE